MSDRAGDARGDQGADPPRYSSRPLPPYSYVPGITPHPVSDPRGHMHGEAHGSVAALDAEDWNSSPAYLYAVDLFNHGFYWEAHEAWESLWHAAGRRGPVALWLKALIKLAAAGVKAREGSANGAERHTRRALELLAEVRRELPASADAFCGLAFSRVDQIAHELLAASTQVADARPRPEWRLTTLLLGER